MAIVPVVLSGGSGTRLWPLSRRLQPKQLLALHGDTTMVQQTVTRVAAVSDVTAPLVVCNAAHAALVERQLAAIDRPARTIVLEPVGRNTAPAVAAAAHVVAQRDPDDLLLVLPADHLVRDVPAFVAALASGRALAEQGQLVTFGVVPDHPHTGFGYIRAAAPGQPSPVEAFVEKPDEATAQGYLDHGGYYWNSGMFLLRAGVYLQELQRWRPDIASACEAAVREAGCEGITVSLDRQRFVQCPSESIDYAVMEKTDRAAVVPMDAGWSDVGSWAALHEVEAHDDAGVATRGDVLALDCRDSLLHARHRTLAAIGLRDLVVVETADAVLVAARDQTEQVKAIVGQLDERGRPQASTHPTQTLAWGRSQRLDAEVEATMTTHTIEAGLATPVVGAESALQVVVLGGRGALRRGDDPDQPLAPGDTVELAAGERYCFAAAADDALVVLTIERPLSR